MVGDDAGQMEFPSSAVRGRVLCSSGGVGRLTPVNGVSDASAHC